MKRPRNFAAIAFAAALGFGMSASTALAAQQTAPTGDHSSGTKEAVGDAWITTKAKSELATTKGVKQVDASGPKAKD